ncbi:histidine kinase/DNA gyrase B/HSP90-like ATPase [Acidovorax sp. 94]|uniref:ATP-binding protein n=1 Tax=Acidovorax sp. 94 TaxID=2135633 RepID=UPI000EB36F20|nr:ATP-binding protein [Acidovorax sp. 94]RKR67859.1 histidine kinase/DNA gyrase B/HSP90-like ATPase [Acidovorax sp. 94]
MSFTPFDPLEFKNTKINSAAFGALKREISNILSSYVGWYDPFCELIQNALDAVEARATAEKSAGTGNEYKPKINIRIDIDENSLTVSDNGIGLDKEKFEQFLAPNFSFKSGNTRGHKGVGATYVAYGFNYMRVTTKVPGFEASGRIINARNWLKDDTSGANPKVEPDSSKMADDAFAAFDRGVSITVRFDGTTHPRQLGWLQATTAPTWQKILYVKTGLGSVIADPLVSVTITVIAKGKISTLTQMGTKYPWLHENASKKSSYNTLTKAQDDLYIKYGPGRKMPDKYSNLDFIYETWTASQLKALLGNALDEEELEVLERYTPTTSVEFGYTAKLWTQFNDELGLRSRVLSSGIQLAANNMPQGETMLIPLTRNIGRQHQVHFLIHFDNYTPDLGRKGFHRELTDFAKSVARHIVETHLSKMRYLLKANTGTSPDLVRELAIDDWKKEMLSHELQQPLKLQSKHFFLPVERVSITSVPTREQDVIALFHQLIAGGVIRGLNMMSTNERFTYDGLFKIAFDLSPQLYIYDEGKNPLGVPKETANALSGKVTTPRILEYKFSLDGLVEDFDSQDKNIKDIDLCVAWTTGETYREKYGIVSLLLPENADQRQYHGVTHVLVDLETGAKFCDLIILSELIEFLNNADETAEAQRIKYE